jgi:SAM-dependent methyltransferase
MVFEPELGKLSKLAGPFGRSESVSSASATSLNYGTMATSSKPSSSHSRDMSSIAVRNGRAYLRDTTNVYPLPVDLQELHRQSLQLLLLIQVFGTPMISLDDADRPPRRILDVGCASGFWSMMCHRHLKAKGFENATFVGMDVAPLAPGSLNGSGKPDRDMNWRFVQHDIRQTPLPFADNEFDHIHIANMCMSTPDNSHQPLMEEYVRILRPGGTIEMWETDTTIRMLRPHVPESMTTDVDTDEDDSDSGDDANGHQYGSLPPMGVYNISASTPLSAPCNPFLVEYNGWVVRALESSRLTAVPCTIMGAMLLQETDVLRDVRSRRVAIPLSTVRWEREGVGGVVTKDGKSYVDWTGKSKSAGMPVESTAKVLSPSHLAIRHTALLSVVGLIQSLEPLLREHSGKSQDEWDIWYGKMTNDLLRGQGTTWGECMETGAWWCKKR